MQIQDVSCTPMTICFMFLTCASYLDHITYPSHKGRTCSWHKSKRQSRNWDFSVCFVSLKVELIWASCGSDADPRQTTQRLKKQNKQYHYHSLNSFSDVPKYTGAES